MEACQFLNDILQGCWNLPTGGDGGGGGGGAKKRNFKKKPLL